MVLTTELLMIIISLIAVFITILGGFGSLGAFLWQQFSKINSTLHEIKSSFVTDQKCRERMENCTCANKMQKLLQIMRDKNEIDKKDLDKIDS